MARSFLKKFMCAAMAGTLGIGMPISANAEDSGSAAVTSEVSETESSQDSEEEHVSGEQTLEGGASNDAGGEIEIIYSTSEGRWMAPGQNVQEESDDEPHVNGMFVITIPKSIHYYNIPVGTINAYAEYTVNLRGSLGNNKKLTLTAYVKDSPEVQGQNRIIKNVRRGDISAWSGEQVFGGMNEDGSVTGNNVKDTILFSGTAVEECSCSAIVVYTATVDTIEEEQ